MNKIRKGLMVLLIACVVFSFGDTKEAFAESGSIVIDGYFDDWELVPKTNISWGSHNGREWHKMAMVIDGDYLCIYAHLSDMYMFQIPVDGYTLTINGRERTFIIRRTLPGGFIDYFSLPYFLPRGIYADEFGVFDQNGGFMSVGDAAIAITRDPNDSLEFRIRLDTLEELFGFRKGTLENGTKIELNNWNLGFQRVTIVGTSTGAVIGLAACISVSGAILLFRKKRKRRGV